MSHLIIENVTKSFGDFQALKGIDLNVGDGEFVVLVGPSGCGKSTLLRCIAGLERISGGTIALDGRDLAPVATRERNVAMVFQSYALFPHLNVAENIAFGLKLRRAPADMVQSKVDNATRMLGLSDLLDRRPRELSGGQRQRVAMGRAIVRDPAIFLFDEPLSNLDAKLRVQMRTEIKSLRQRLKKTSIYVTHDQDEAMTLADRIVVMNGGRIEQVGTPLQLYDTPTNLFVAGFMGSPPMNFIGLRRAQTEDAILTAGGQAVPLPEPLRRACPSSAILGVRPEALHLTADGPFFGVVDVVEPRGSDMLVYARFDDGTLVCVQAGKRAQVAPGDRIGFAPDMAEVHLFDSATQNRIGSAHLGETQ